jgi:hypothetical protein
MLVMPHRSVGEVRRSGRNASLPTPAYRQAGVGRRKSYFVSTSDLENEISFPFCHYKEVLREDNCDSDSKTIDLRH